MAIRNINGTGWDESFQLLYTYKAEVEKASPGSVVEIDHHNLSYKGKSGKMIEKTNFRRAFVSFKACHQGFVSDCRPYLAVEWKMERTVSSCLCS